jgi:hypothetical protein
VSEVPHESQKVRNAQVSVLYRRGSPVSHLKSARFTMTQATACAPAARRQFSQ